MCRLIAFFSDRPRRAADLLTSDPHSLLAQSRCDLRGECHGDGWGIGWFRQGRPEIVRSTAAASTDPEWNAASESVLSEAVIGHVRQASVGSLSLENTHPFVHGRWIFAHNGTLTGFDQLSPRMVEEIGADLRPWRVGTTDSELIFYWLLERLRNRGVDPTGGESAELATVMQVMGTAVVELAARSAGTGPEEAAKLNLVLTDGRLLAASRWEHGLFYREAGPETGGARELVIASEPTDERAWQELPNRVILGVDRRFQNAINRL